MALLPTRVADHNVEFPETAYCFRDKVLTKCFFAKVPGYRQTNAVLRFDQVDHLARLALQKENNLSLRPRLPVRTRSQLLVPSQNRRL